MEKLLDDMLSDLQDSPQKQTGFSEYDRLMIKYALTPKGHNLRNRVAHGLMDLWEYSFVDIVILLYLIIKLSSYKFSPKINWNIVVLKIAKKILLAILLLIKYITRIVVN